VLASDHSLAGQLRRSTALGPVEILLGIITFATALGEGAANERLTLMLVDNRGVPPRCAYVCGFERDDGYRSISGGVVIQRYVRAPVLRAAGVLACTGVGRVVFSKSTLIALLGALADGDALETSGPSKNPTDIFALS
jgi:hypothetical protein